MARIGFVLLGSIFFLSIGAARAAEQMPAAAEKFVDEFRRECRELHSDLRLPAKFVEEVAFSALGVDALIVNTTEFECEGVRLVFGKPTYRTQKMFSRDGREILSFGGYEWHVDGDRFVVLHSGIDCRGSGGRCQSVFEWNGKVFVRSGIVSGEHPAVPPSATAIAPPPSSVEPAVAAPILTDEEVKRIQDSGNAKLADHNGSEVLIDWDGGRIVYLEPKASISGTVRRGQVLFSGKLDFTAGTTSQGTAFVFKKACAPAPYAVTGHSDGTTLTFQGSAPKRSSTGCEVIGASTTSANATLVFGPRGDSGAQAIVGKWHLANESCRDLRATMSIQPMALATEDWFCKFRDVSRKGEVVTWKGLCGSADNLTDRTTAVAQRSGTHLLLRINGGEASDLIRCE